MTNDRGIQLLDDFSREGRTAFSAAEVQARLALSPQATSNLLSRLTKAGLLDRLAGGRYAIRPLGAFGTAAAWDDLGSAVAAVFAGQPHRIGFLTALDHHGLLVRPVRPVQVASSYRPREKTLAGRPFRVVQEDEGTVLMATEPLGPSRIATVERALLDTASRPQLTGGASRLAEALAAAAPTKGLRELATAVRALPGYRRIGSIAHACALQVAQGLEPPSWHSLIELDRRARGENGWVDKAWGVAWPYPRAELEVVIAA